MDKKSLAYVLDNLVNQRVFTLEDIEMSIRNHFTENLGIYLSFRDEPYDEKDYDIVGIITILDDNDDIVKAEFCNFDIYYAKTKNDEMLITGIKYVFDEECDE